MPSINDTAVSLRNNLKFCLVPLSKLHGAPGLARPIADELKKLMDCIELCQRLCFNEDSPDTYKMVLNRLYKANASDHTLLHIYFSRSPYWEHYHRNVTEILVLLEKTVNERQENDKTEKTFKRRFLPLFACMSHWNGTVNGMYSRVKVH